MRAFFQQSAVRRWLVIAAVAAAARAVAFWPGLPQLWVTGIVIGGAAAMGVATIGLSVLVGRSLRARGRLAAWEMPGLGIMVLALALTNPLFLPHFVAPGWMFAIAWGICTIGLVAGILGYMASQDRRRAEYRRAEDPSHSEGR